MCVCVCGLNYRPIFRLLIIPYLVTPKFCAKGKCPIIILRLFHHPTSGLPKMAAKEPHFYAGWSKSPCAQHTSFLPHYVAQSDCLAADHQGQGDRRLKLTPSVIPNSNYVIMVSDWNCLNIFACFLYRNYQAHREGHKLLCSDTPVVCTGFWNQKYGLWILDSEVINF
jgi:hypothetical protein